MYIDKLILILYHNPQCSLGGSIMNNRTRELNSLVNSEAIIASFIGLFIIARPVVRRSMQRL